MFWKKFIELCNKNNISPNAVAKAIGISSASVTYWKNGSQPRDTALKKIADFFGVSVEFLLSKEKGPSNNEELENVISYHRDGKTVRMKLTKKQLDAIHNLIQTIKESDEDL